MLTDGSLIYSGYIYKLNNVGNYLFYQYVEIYLIGLKKIVFLELLYLLNLFEFIYKIACLFRN